MTATRKQALSAILLPCFLLAVRAAGAEAIFGPEAASLSTTWTGAYSCNSTVFTITLNLQIGDDGVVRGSVASKPVNQRRNRGPSTQESGIRGTYNRQTGAVALATESQLWRQTFQLNGTFALDGNEWVGVIGNYYQSGSCTPWVARRGKRLSALVEAAVDAGKPENMGFGRASTMNSLQTAMQSKRAQSRNSCPKDIVAWISQVPEADPNVRSRSPWQRLGPLFTDERFKPHFGTAFRDMKTGRRKEAFFNVSSGCTRDAQLSQDQQTVLGMTASAFQNMQPFTAADAQLRAEAAGIAARWRDAILDRIGSATNLEIADLDAVEADAQTLSALSWPTDKQRFAQRMGKQRAALIEPTLMAELQSIVDRARTSGAVNEIVGLRNFEQRNASAFKQLDQAARQRVDGAVAAAANTLIEDTAGVELDALAGRAAGLARLEETGQWYRKYSGALQAYPSSPAALDALDTVRIMRATSANAASAEWQSKIEASTSTDTLDALARNTFVELDYEIQPVESLRVALNDRRAIIQADQRRAQMAREEEQRQQAAAARQTELADREKKLTTDPHFIAERALKCMVMAVVVPDEPSGLGEWKDIYEKALVSTFNSLITVRRLSRLGYVNEFDAANPMSASERLAEWNRCQSDLRVIRQLKKTNGLEFIADVDVAFLYSGPATVPPESLRLAGWCIAANDYFVDMVGGMVTEEEVAETRSSRERWLAHLVSLMPDAARREELLKLERQRFDDTGALIMQGNAYVPDASFYIIQESAPCKVQSKSL